MGCGSFGIAEVHTPGRHFGFRFVSLGVPLLVTALAHAQVFTEQGNKLVGTGSLPSPTPPNATVIVGVQQGTSVALSTDGNTALIGGPGDNNREGAVWVFVRNAAGAWSQQGDKLVAADAAGAAQMGQSVALSADGNTALVGGPADNNSAGAAWIFTRSTNGTWTQQGSKLVGSGAVMVPGTGCVAGSCAPLDLIQQGWAVALSADGNTALESGKGDNNYMGAVWVFTRSSNGAWTQQGNKLVGTGSVPGPFNLPGTPNQGYSVALSGDGNTAAVGGPYDGNYRGSFGAYSGAVWVFTRNGSGQWSQQGSKLIASNVVVDSVFAEEGTSVALSADGNTLLTGGPQIQQGAVTNAGEAWVFTRDGSGNWSEQGSGLIGTGAVGGALQGQSVALSSDGNTALVGGPNDLSGTGAAWVFSRDSNGNWTQQGQKLVGGGALYGSNAYIDQGSSVALSGDGSTALLGAPSDDSYLGAAWPFVRSLPLFTSVPGALTQISVGADGSVWGINTYQQIYTYDFSAGSWSNIPGSLVQIAVGSSTAVYGINAEQQIYQWDAADSKWIKIPGLLTQIAVGADGDVWGLNYQSSIYHYNPQTGYFAEITGTLKQIAVGSAGAVYGVHTDGGIYWFNPGTGSFQLVANSSGFTQVSVGVDGDMWAVKNEIAYHYDALHNSMDPTPGSIAQVAVGFGGNVLGLNAEGQIYQWNAVSADWVEIPGELSSIAVGANGTVWGINSAQQIYRFGGPTRPFQTLSGFSTLSTQISVGADGSVWGLDADTVEYFNSETQNFQVVTGAPALTQLSVGAGADVWGLDGSGNVYQYNATAGTWSNILGVQLSNVQVGADGSVWGINSAGQIFTVNFSNSTWDNIPGQLSTLSVGADGTVWGLNTEQQIYRFDSTTQSWVNVPGALTHISVGNTNNVWGINAQSQVYYYNNATQSWVVIPGASLVDISVAFDGSVWGIDSAGNLYQWDSNTQSFSLRGPNVTSASVGNAVAVWAVNSFTNTVLSWF